MSTDPLSSTGQQNVVKSTNVQVAVRCRPINAEEKKAGQPPVVNCDVENKSVKVAYGPTGKRNIKSFAFDRVFGMYSRQQEVFDTIVRPIVDEVLEGFNCTIFAYGQTGTGKTHTMEGNINSEEDAGIVPRSVRSIFEKLEASGVEFTIRVSFLELYNEELQDLLNVSSDKKLKLCEDVKKGVVCQNLEEFTVLTANDIFDIIARGIQQRQTAATLCNKNSSRSHSIFTMKIMIKECNVEGEEVVRHGQLNLVDLAGSECVGRSGAKNDRAREAGSINQSLLTLGRVITALVDHHGHIPYRDSKLTRLLQESLGGKAKTCIIATLSPSALAVEETLSTLDYAYRAKSIKNQPTVNQRLTKKVIMKEYLQELESLKSQLQLTREKNGVYLDPATFYEMETKLAAQELQLQECESALAMRDEEVKLVRNERDDLSLNLTKLTAEHESTVQQLDVAQKQLQKAQGEVCSAYVELRAAEAVVSEQQTTEKLLHVQGAALQSDLTSCRSDVEMLVCKVNRLSESERQKLHDSSTFVVQLQQRCDSLLSQVQHLQKHGSTQAESLNSGVSQMLQHGRATCASLQAAISEALKVMIGDAEKAKDSMVESCDGLKKHLNNTNERLAETLQSLQCQLSAWLQQVDETLQGSQQQLSAQQEQIAKASAAIAEHCDKLQGESDAFLTLQTEQKDAAIASTADLQQAIVAKLRDMQEAISKHAEKSSSELQNNAAEMETKMKKFLQEMVRQSCEAFASSKDQTSSFCSSAAELLDNQLSTTQSTIATLYNSSAKHSQQLRTASASASTSHSSFMETVESHRSSASNTNAEICNTVGVKRKFLDDTVSSLLSVTEDAIVAAVDVVNSTSTTARTVLTDVSNASSQMEEAAKSSTTTFTEFMDREGEQLRCGVSKHFEVLEKHSSDQVHALTSLSSSGDQHRTAMEESALQHTGNTPVKAAAYRSLQSPLKKSRFEVEIKAESRLALGEIHYEEASNGLGQELVEKAEAGVEEVVPMETNCNPRLSKESSHSLSSLSLPSVDSSDVAVGENADPNEAAAVVPTPKGNPSKSPMKPQKQNRSTKRTQPQRNASKTRNVAMDAI